MSIDLFDCGAGALFASDFLDEVGLAEGLRTIDACLTVVCPVNHEADSVEQLRKTRSGITPLLFQVFQNEPTSLPTGAFPDET